ncbi:hypothetical protein CFIMG_006561RA [Ceratocystis fimbriata CBS 114723]|uniref:Uncharacterized protein n=1 Tax=Ceratocystis fimbriata CBS 114723 TaxID=1035309 RepID=A0A2C5WI16_9PEZI|nr:hypothetical protein CFIMG_006561RA [Ceratocystis fimbriata CBS 114723]
MPGPKKTKHAKEGGIIASSVKRHHQPQQLQHQQNGVAAKPSPPSAEISPHTLTFDVEPNADVSDISNAGVSAIPAGPAAAKATTVPSPVLDALSTTSVSTSTAPSIVPDWTQNPLSSSPGNFHQLSSDSPPTQPSSFEDSARLPSTWSQRQAAYSTSISPSPIRTSISPSPIQPSSYQTDLTHYPGEHHLSGKTRRGSTISQYGSARLASNASHKPQSQAYYYGAPDMDIDPTQQGLRAGDRGYHYGFDAFPRRNIDGPATFATDTAILAGYEGGLEVYALTKRSVEPCYELSGLRGGVINAKLLPWATNGDQERYPMAVVVIHGPMVPEKQITQSPFSLNNAPARGDTRVDGSPIKIGYYQTSVEVYSLKTNERIDVLLKLPPIPISPAIPITSELFEPPPPAGLLTLRADSGYIAVSSGSSGEVWVFSHISHVQALGTRSHVHRAHEAGGQFHSPESGTRPHVHESGSQFGCLAKLWTAVQQRLRTDAVDETSKAQMQVPVGRTSNLQPILALNGRWLAYCPPSPSSQLPIKAEIAVPLLGKAPGVHQATPSQVPTPFTGVDQPLDGGFMNKFMRETTQELIHGAKWVGQQGINVLQSYWSKPNSTATMARSPPNQTWGSSYPPKTGLPFPPTHGASTPVSTKEPGIVCLIDLENLGNMANIHPFSTFLLAGGCSYLAFSPTGLSLFTASTKGDVQAVWDLMRTQHTKSSLIQISGGSGTGNSGSAGGSGITGVHIRQIAQFSRLTEARIIDVSWTKPNGEEIAMVTERGTVHLLDMPCSAFSWPPPRRRAESRYGYASSVAGDGTGSSAVSLASNAIGAALVAARPLMNRPRRSSANVQASNNSSSSHFVESASQGGRMIAASISSSIGKTGHAINQLRQNAENRVAIPSMSSSRPPVPGCAAWVARNGHNALFVASNGLVRTFPSKSRRMSTPAATASASVSNKGRYPRDSTAYRDLVMPTLPDNHISDYVKNLVFAEDELVMSDHEMEAGNRGLADNRRVSCFERPTLRPTVQATIPEAEIESSAPYQPFHTDRRISLYEYHMKNDAAVASTALAFTKTGLEDKNHGHEKAARKKRSAAASAPPAHAPHEPSTHLSIPQMTHSAPTNSVWVFGQPLATTRLDLGAPEGLDDDMIASLEDHRALPASAMERTMQQIGRDEQILITTRRRRGVRNDIGASEDDGFFEDDCEVLDFADQRV